MEKFVKLKHKENVDVAIRATMAFFRGKEHILRTSILKLDSVEDKRTKFEMMVMIRLALHLAKGHDERNGKV